MRPLRSRTEILMTPLLVSEARAVYDTGNAAAGGRISRSSVFLGAGEAPVERRHCSIRYRQASNALQVSSFFFSAALHARHLAMNSGRARRHETYNIIVFLFRAAAALRIVALFSVLHRLLASLTRCPGAEAAWHHGKGENDEQAAQQRQDKHVVPSLALLKPGLFGFLRDLAVTVEDSIAGFPCP